MGEVLADPLLQSLAAAAGILLLVVAGRKQLLNRLDAWIFPETVDQRQTWPMWRLRWPRQGG